MRQCGDGEPLCCRTRQTPDGDAVTLRLDPVTMASQPVVSASIEIAAPASHIFDILADPRRHVEIDGSDMLRRCLHGPERLRLGSEFVMSMRLSGFPYRVRNRVVEFEDNRLIAGRHFEPQHWRFQLEPTESGTRVTETFDYSYWPRAGRLLLVGLGWPRRNKPAITQDTRVTRKRSADQSNRNEHIASSSGWPRSMQTRKLDGSWVETCWEEELACRLLYSVVRPFNNQYAGLNHRYQRLSAMRRRYRRLASRRGVNAASGADS